MADPDVAQIAAKDQETAAVRDAKGEARIVAGYWKELRDLGVTAALANKLTQDWQRARLWPDYPPDEEED